MGGTERTYLSQNDVIMWTVEADPLLRSTIVGVVLLDRAPAWADVQRRVEQTTHRVPELREKVVAVPLRPSALRWVPEPDVDLDYHLRRVRVPSPAGVREVLDLARTFAANGFDRSRPLWEFTLVEGMADGGAAFIMKAHHVVTDGIGAVQLAAHLFDFDPEAPIVSPLPSDVEVRHAPSTAELMRDLVVHDVEGIVDLARRAVPSVVPALFRAVRDPFHAVAETISTLASVGRTIAPVTDTLSAVMTDRHQASSFDVVDVSLAALHDAAKVAGGTVNDAFLAGITGGLRRYHEAMGVEVEDLRVAMPVSIRHADDGIGGNHVSVMRFKVPVGVDEPEERIRRLHEVGRHVRAEKSLGLTETIAGVLNLMPPGVIGSMLKHIDFLASNVPGVPVPMWLCGAHVRRFFPFGPTAGSSVNVTLMSYDGRACMGVNVDTAAITHTALFMDCLREGFDEVVAISR
jgi:diacylglycerol O-acyltransferase